MAFSREGDTRREESLFVSIYCISQMVRKVKRHIIVLGWLVALGSCSGHVGSGEDVRKHLYGYWSLEGVTWLKIASDSIYFVDEEEAAPIRYAVERDTLIWYFDGMIQKSRFTVLQDTLFVESEEGKATYVRVK